MRSIRALQAAVGLTALACSIQAKADVLSFTGSMTGIGIVSPDPACAPRSRGIINPASTVGSSSLGAFTYGHSVCTSGPPGGPLDGAFDISFGSDGFFGSLAGASAANPTMPGIFDFDIAWTVLGGTGRFAGATGAFFSGPGSNANINFRPSHITFNFVNGQINAPAVPEPATWAMLILGFGAVGWSLRYRSARRALA